MPLRAFALLILAGILFTNDSCSLTKGKETGEQAVIQFHNQFNAGLFHEIYVTASEDFRKATSEADMLAYFEAINRKLGTVKSSEQGGWRVGASPMGSIVTLQYNSEFSDGKAVEFFIFLIKDDKALLQHYKVDSPTLILK